MTPKFYVKIKDEHGARVYLPCVEGVVFDYMPCKTASEAQKKGYELFLAGVKAYQEQNQGEVNGSRQFDS